MVPIVIYSTDYCPYCRMAEKTLTSQKLQFTSIDVTHDDAKRQWLVETTGQKTVPQIFVGDTSVGGYSDLVAKIDSGEFQKLLQGR
jgi:glutaredoxin 3